MVKAEVDMPTLLRSLKRASKAFGEDSSQATIRWGVATARELAKQAQAWGESAKSLKAQKGAIRKDAKNVLRIVPKLRRFDAMNLLTAKEVIEWIDKNRTGRRKRTKPLPDGEKKKCTSEVFEQAMEIKTAMAGVAKGGFIGAGEDIAKAQRGSGKISIPASILKHTRKHANFGKSKAARPSAKPVSELRNTARHSGMNHVLSEKRANSAVKWGLKKTIKWYEKTMEASLKKA